MTRLKIVSGAGDAPKLNGCCYCKSYKEMGDRCPDAKFGNGNKAGFLMVDGWTCAAFRQIGASQE